MQQSQSHKRRYVAQGGLAVGLIGVSAIAMGMVWPTDHVLTSIEDSEAAPVSTEPTQPAVTELGAADVVAADTYSRVMRLRRDAGLTNHDLAALGLSQEVSEAALSRLITWVSANHPALIQAEHAIQDKQRALFERERAVRIGADEEHSFVVIDNAREAVAEAEAAYLALCDRGVMDALSVTPRATQQRWQDASQFRGRGSSGDRGLPIELRYITSMSDRRADELGDRLDVPGALGEVLTSLEQSGVDAVRAQVAAHLAGVATAEDAVLPLPEELQEPEYVEQENEE